MKVLIADDDPVISIIIQENLVREGYETVIASNGLESWQILQQDEPPQIAILDWMMPEMNGLEVCRRIKERPVEAPPLFILLITAKKDPEDIVAGFDMGADDYITKPFITQELLARVRVGARLMTMQTLLTNRATKAEHQYREVMDHAADGIFHTGLDDRLVAVNPAFVRLLGFESKPHLLSEIKTVPFDLPDGQYAEILQSVKEKGMIQGIETRIQPIDGDPIWVSLSVRMLYNTDGDVIGYEGTVQDISQRVQVEEERNRSQTQLRALASRLQTIREEERTRIAREIHDELGQALTGVKLDLYWLEQKISTLPGCPPELREQFQNIAPMIDGTISSIRRIARELRPSVLDQLGLPDAIESELESFNKRTNIQYLCDFEDDLNVPADPATVLFRILQEALTNIVRHAEATIVNLSLKKDENGYIMTISDNGTGIDESRISDSQSLGILGIQERAAMVDGSVQIQGTPGVGTILQVSIPGTWTSSEISA